MYPKITMEKLSNNDVTTLCPLDNDDSLNDINGFSMSIESMLSFLTQNIC